MVKRKMWQKYTMKYRQAPPKKVWDQVQRRIRETFSLGESMRSSTAVRKWNNKLFRSPSAVVLQSNNNYKTRKDFILFEFFMQIYKTTKHGIQIEV